MTLFSDEQLVALSNVLESLILCAAALISALVSTIDGTLPTPTPKVGVPLCIDLKILFCEPVATTRST